jgi:hypothetical protein
MGNVYVVFKFYDIAGFNDAKNALRIECGSSSPNNWSYNANNEIAIFNGCNNIAYAIEICRNYHGLQK